MKSKPIFKVLANDNGVIDYGETLRVTREDILEWTQKRLAAEMSKQQVTVTVDDIKNWENNRNLEALRDNKALFKNLSDTLHRGLAEKSVVDKITADQFHDILKSILEGTINGDRELAESFGVQLVQFRKQAGFASREEFFKNIAPDVTFTGREVAAIESAGYEPREEFTASLRKLPEIQSSLPALDKAFERTAETGWAKSVRTSSKKPARSETKRPAAARELAPVNFELPEKIRELIDQVNVAKRKVAAYFIPEVETENRALTVKEVGDVAVRLMKKQSKGGAEIFFSITPALLNEVDPQQIRRIDPAYGWDEQDTDTRKQHSRLARLPAEAGNRIAAQIPEKESALLHDLATLDELKSQARKELRSWRVELKQQAMQERKKAAASR